MKTHPASKLQICPFELNGAHQCKYVRFNTSGEFKLTQGKETGWGALCRFNGDSDIDVNASYVGGLHEFNAEGHGQLHVQDEFFSYIGGWRDNLASGWGKWCDSWTEEWPDGVMHYRTVTYVHKTMFYEGGFKDGYFHGYGELTWETGANYKGSWKEGRRDGCGVYTTADGNDRYYWTSTLPDGCSSEDSDSSDKYKKEHKLRQAAEKKYKEELAKEEKATTKCDEEHKKKEEVECKLKKKQDELAKETEMYYHEHTRKEVAEAELKLLKEEHQQHHGHLHLF